MHVAAQDLEDETNQIEDVHANNNYIEPKNSHPDEFEDDDWVNSTYMENMRVTRLRMLGLGDRVGSLQRTTGLYSSLYCGPSKDLWSSCVV